MSVLDIFDDHDCAPFAFDGFASLIAPVGQQRFLDEYWERKPFLVRRGRTGYFDDVLSMEAVDTLIGARVLREGDVRLASFHQVRSFEQISRDGVADRGTLLREHKEGSTVVFDQVDRLHAPLGEMLARCEVDLQLPCRANAFLTPPGQQGFKLHYDTHDVVVLQLAGTKDWQICDNPLPLPHEEQQYDHSLTAVAKPLTELTMHPGDVLFLPRGFIHAASANDTTSLHVSIALRTRAMREVAVGALRRAVQDSPVLRKAVLFRGSRDSGRVAQVRAELHRLADNLDIQAALDEVLKSFITQRSRPRHGALLQLESPPELDDASVLQLRPDCLSHPFREGDMVRLLVDGRKLTLPAGVLPALELIRSGVRFRPAELPGLEEESRLLLARKLHDAGMLAVHG